MIHILHVGFKKINKFVEPSQQYGVFRIADDSEIFYCDLTMISAFPFENLLGKIRNVLRSGYTPIEQLCNGMQEKFFSRQKIPSVLQDTKVMRGKICLVDPRLSIVKRVLFKEVVLSSKSADDIVLLKNNNVCFEIRRMYRLNAVEKFVYTNNKIFNAKNMSLLFLLLFSQFRLL